MTLNEDELARQQDELKKLEQELEESKCQTIIVANQSLRLGKEGEEGELVESGEQASATGDAEANNDPDERSVFVKNVDYGADEPQISEHFKLCGEITRVTIRKNHHT